MTNSPALVPFVMGRAIADDATPCAQEKTPAFPGVLWQAGDRTRTDNNLLGRQILYQLSYARDTDGNYTAGRGRLQGEQTGNWQRAMGNGLEDRAEGRG